MGIYTNQLVFYLLHLGFITLRKFYLYSINKLLSIWCRGIIPLIYKELMVIIIKCPNQQIEIRQRTVCKVKQIISNFREIA